jgi:twitching motility protein PilJ
MLIKNVQVETQEAIAATDQGTSEVEADYRITLQTGKSLREISEIAQKSAKLAQDISIATQHQVRGAESVAVGAQSIAAVTVHTEQGVVRTRKAVEELVQVAEELTSSLSRFKLAV